jgi:ABC-type dipeptide/oligopeptide/nickel transport system permease component
MIGFILGRLMRALPLVIGLALLVFVLAQLAPDRPQGSAATPDITCHLVRA